MHIRVMVCTGTCRVMHAGAGQVWDKTAWSNYSLIFGSFHKNMITRGPLSTKWCVKQQIHEI